MCADCRIGYLKGEIFSVGREISFCIVATESEFLDIFEIVFLGIQKR